MSNDKISGFMKIQPKWNPDKKVYEDSGLFVIYIYETTANGDPVQLSTRKVKQEIFEKYLQLDLTPNIVTQTVKSQRTLDEKDIKEKHNGKVPFSLADFHKYDKICMLGVYGRSQLKKLGGLPKNSWSFGCNDVQTVACWYRFYELKPDYIVDAYEERLKMLKNPFKDVFSSEETAKIHEGLNKKLAEKSPVDDYGWWVREGQFLKSEGFTV